MVDCDKKNNSKICGTVVVWDDSCTYLFAGVVIIILLIGIFLQIDTMRACQNQKRIDESDAGHMINLLAKLHIAAATTSNNAEKLYNLLAKPQTAAVTTSNLGYVACPKGDSGPPYPPGPQGAPGERGFTRPVSPENDKWDRIQNTESAWGCDSKTGRCYPSNKE